MADTIPFAQILLVVSAASVVAILSNRLSAVVRVPAPLFFLIGAAVAVEVVPSLKAPPDRIVERVVTVCLLCILFDGGMHIGRRRFTAAAAPILITGVVGTFLTTTAAALLAHVAFGLSWYVSVLLGAVVAPTDPAIVFSVLGQREIAGRAGTILEGESGANDPVGIALVASLLAAGAINEGAFWHADGQFLLQMGVGVAGGIAGGWALLWFMRRVSLPSEGLYPLRTLACALLLDAVVTVLHGSGFLAVFVAGIMIGDERAPFKREIERFHGALASLAEFAAFVTLGLTVDLRNLVRVDVWVPGVVLAVALAVVIRPLLVGICLIPARLRRGETAFVLFAGLKGAVPLLLGVTVVSAGTPGGQRVYGVITVVVILSILVQGSLVPAVANALHLRLRVVEPQPWALGVRLADEPEDTLRLTVQPRSPAAGQTIGEIGALLDEDSDFWTHLMVRDHRVIPARGDQRLEVGDELVITAETTAHPDIERIFSPSANP